MTPLKHLLLGWYILTATSLSTHSSAFSFSLPLPVSHPTTNTGTAVTTTTPTTTSLSDHRDGSQRMTRTTFLSTLVTLTTINTTTMLPPLASADDNNQDSTTTTSPSSSSPEPVIPTPGKSYTIDSCSASSKNCVSTSSIKQAISTYSAPWTFDCTPDGAFLTLLDLLRAESSIEVNFVDEDARYVQATAARTLSVYDTLEFVVRAQDAVVVYRSSESNNSGGGISDFGANRARLDKLRAKSGGVFGVMGSSGGGDYDDYYMGGAKGGGGSNGVLGQLKAFYGLQSGEGFQDVFD